MALLLVWACTSSSPPPPPQQSVLDDGWIARIVAEPAVFAATIDAARPAWVALHRNDWAGALDGPTRQRAAAELARLHRVLADLTSTGWLALGARWDTNGGTPPGSLLPALVWAVAVDAGDQASAERWKPRAATVLGPRVAAGDPLDPGVDDALRATVSTHAALRGSGEPALDPTLGTTPLAVEAGGERELWDPWVHRSLAARWARLAEAPPAGSPGAGGPGAGGISASLFSSELGHAGVATDATLTALSLAIPGGDDDAEACRELVRGLDTRLDAWATQLGTNASDEGRALLHDLALVPATRSRVLVDLAVAALQERRPRCAMAYAEMARDHAAGREVTPVNSPTLYAVLASAALHTGHTREALDAVEVLSVRFPEVRALDETLGDLAVLEGIHRAGDSREH